MKRVLYLAISLVLAVSIVLIGGCGAPKATSPAGSSNSQEKVKVLVSIYPVYDFVKQIGGDKIEVTQLVPPGVEPHEWEPTAQDMIKVKSAKVFLYQGNGFESWVDKMLKERVAGQTVMAIGENLADLDSVAEEEHDHDKSHEGHNQGDLKHDPHVWLDPIKVKAEVQNIVQALSEADPNNKAYYEANGAKVQESLDQLNQEYAQALSKVTNRNIVTTHAAFGYLANRYELRQVPIMGLSPDAEPTPDKMAEVVRFVKDHQVKAIFFETLVSPKLAETISRETGAKTLVLNPLEGLTEEELNLGQNYFTTMRSNLDHLKQALE